MQRRKFTREFKLEAVRLIRGRGVSYIQALQDLRVTYLSFAIGGRSSPRIRSRPSQVTGR